jgi:hypothetical protein
MWSPNGRLYWEQRVGSALESIITEHDLTSGRQREVARTSGQTTEFAPDGQTLFFGRPISGSTSLHDLIARDVASGVEKTLARLPDETFLRVSPDGRFIAARGQEDRAAKSNVLLLIPTARGEPRELSRGVEFAAWSPDSRSIIGRKSMEPDSPNSPLTYSWIPLDGTAPRVLDLHSATGGGAVFAQGNRLLFVERFTQPRQVHVLENFLPKSK